MIFFFLLCVAKPTDHPQGEDVPNFPELRELGDLSDGMSLLGLLAFYAPDLVDWTRIATNEPFSMADCLYNLELVHKFCSESLPNNIFHLGLEDIVYMHRYNNEMKTKEIAREILKES